MEENQRYSNNAYIEDNGGEETPHIYEQLNRHKEVPLPKPKHSCVKKWIGGTETKITWKKIILIAVIISTCISLLQAVLSAVILKNELLSRISDVYQCSQSDVNTNKKNFTYMDCKELKRLGKDKDGIYKISPDGNISFNAYCDMNNGGWTLIQRRMDDEVSFDRNWTDYAHGFGNLSESHWLGLEYIHLLTRNINQIYFNITIKKTGKLATAMYDGFYIEGANQKYRMHVDNNTDMYNSEMLRFINDKRGFHFHDDQQFSTKDDDNDDDAGDCSKYWNCGGYWFKDCFGFGCFNGPFDQIYILHTSDKIQRMEIKIRR